MSKTLSRDNDQFFVTIEGEQTRELSLHDPLDQLLIKAADRFDRSAIYAQEAIEAVRREAERSLELGVVNGGFGSGPFQQSAPKADQEYAAMQAARVALGDVWVAWKKIEA